MCTSYLSDLYYLFFVSTLLWYDFGDRFASQTTRFSHKLLKARNIASNSEVVVLVSKNAHSILSKELSNQSNYFSIVFFRVDELGSHNYVVL